MTLKERIRSDIETKIFSGRWPPGHRVPNEHELVDKYGCSRMTVNNVLSELAAKGIIERRRRAGTFVAKPRVQSAVLRIPDIKAEVEELGYSYRYELLSLRRRPTTKVDRELMQLSPKHIITEFRCLHWANQQPFAYEHRFLNVTAVPKAREQSFAQSLRVPKGAACLVVQRRTWRGGEMITHVRTTFQAALYRLNAHFTPNND